MYRVRILHNKALTFRHFTLRRNALRYMKRQRARGVGGIHWLFDLGRRPEPERTEIAWPIVKGEYE